MTDRLQRKGRRKVKDKNVQVCREAKGLSKNRGWQPPWSVPPAEAWWVAWEPQLRPEVFPPTDTAISLECNRLKIFHFFFGFLFFSAGILANLRGM